MKKYCIVLLTTLFLLACPNKSLGQPHIISSDIELFWSAFDRVTATTDTVKQDRILQEEYISKGSPGLHAMMHVRNYTVQDYRNAINNYPKFWASIRDNTAKAKHLQTDLGEGVQKLKVVYPELRHAKIYFTVGAMRSNGTTLDSMVLIGSEFAMADKQTVTSEFPEQMQGLRTFFDSEPIKDLVLLNVHEYVHTQQSPMIDNLLSQCLYEGVAEFVSVKAMGQPSAAPAIEYGKANEEKVKRAFERDMFVNGKTSQWLWSNQPNAFNTRDMGYFIGYAICEAYYNASADKHKAIKHMIELDHTNDAEIEAFVDWTGFFSAPLGQLFTRYDASRPTVVSISPQVDSTSLVDSKLKRLTLTFSEPMNKERRGFDFGPLGEENALFVQQIIGFSEDGLQFTFEVDLKPGRTYQSLASNRFEAATGIPMKPYLIYFTTVN
jgi:hypothetical protein